MYRIRLIIALHLTRFALRLAKVPRGRQYHLHPLDGSTEAQRILIDYLNGQQL